MRDQRIEAWAALGLIKARDRLAAGSVGAKPIDGLGREGDEAARAQAMDGVADRRGVGPRNARDRRGCHGRPPVPK